VKNSPHFVVAICAGMIATASLMYSFPSAASKPIKVNSAPTSGKVLSLTNGDLMCYVDIGAGGKKYHLGADFSICNQTKLLNRSVKLTYKRMKVNDCQSNEPCGKTRMENLIVKMKVLPQK
jgi:hypothetical protein